MIRNIEGYIIVDVDGTIADIEHRRKHLQITPKNWDDFFRDMKDDKINEWCKEIILQLAPRYGVMLCTGRMEKHRAETVAWLKKNGLKFPNIIKIFMREDNDFRSDDVVKEEIYLKQIKPAYKNILFVIEDRKRVADMWRRNGLICLHCAEGNF
jgi:hypothetical protein